MDRFGYRPIIKTDALMWGTPHPLKGRETELMQYTLTCNIHGTIMQKVSVKTLPLMIQFIAGSRTSRWRD
jgi:hypothetical protein